jgi:hypothetical protein
MDIEVAIDALQSRLTNITRHIQTIGTEIGEIYNLLGEENAHALNYDPRATTDHLIYDPDYLDSLRSLAIAASRHLEVINHINTTIRASINVYNPYSSFNHMTDNTYIHDYRNDDYNTYMANKVAVNESVNHVLILEHIAYNKRIRSDAEVDRVMPSNGSIQTSVNYEQFTPIILPRSILYRIPRDAVDLVLASERDVIKLDNPPIDATLSAFYNQGDARYPIIPVTHGLRQSTRQSLRQSPHLTDMSRQQGTFDMPKRRQNAPDMFQYETVDGYGQDTSTRSTNILPVISRTTRQRSPQPVNRIQTSYDRYTNTY